MGSSHDETPHLFLFDIPGRRRGGARSVNAHVRLRRPFPPNPCRREQLTVRLLRLSADLSARLAAGLSARLSAADSARAIPLQPGALSERWLSGLLQSTPLLRAQ